MTRRSFFRCCSRPMVTWSNLQCPLQCPVFSSSSHPPFFFFYLLSLTPFCSLSAVHLRGTLNTSHHYHYRYQAPKLNLKRDSQSVNNRDLLSLPSSFSTSFFSPFSIFSLHYRHHTLFFLCRYHHITTHTTHTHSSHSNGLNPSSLHLCAHHLFAVDKRYGYFCPITV
jgi:hypothetical protein